LQEKNRYQKEKLSLTIFSFKKNNKKKFKTSEFFNSNCHQKPV